MCHKGQTPRVTDDFRAFSENEKRGPHRGEGGALPKWYRVAGHTLKNRLDMRRQPDTT